MDLLITYFNFSDLLNKIIPFFTEAKLLKDNNIKQDIEQYMNIDKKKSRY